MSVLTLTGVLVIFALLGVILLAASVALAGWIIRGARKDHPVRDWSHLT